MRSRGWTIVFSASTTSLNFSHRFRQKRLHYHTSRDFCLQSNHPDNPETCQLFLVSQWSSLFESMQSIQSSAIRTIKPLSRIVCKKVYNASYQACWAECSISATLFPHRNHRTNLMVFCDRWPHRFRLHARRVATVMHLLTNNTIRMICAMLAYLEQSPNASCVPSYQALEGDVGFEKDEEKQKMNRVLGCLEMEREDLIRARFCRTSGLEHRRGSSRRCWR